MSPGPRHKRPPNTRGHPAEQDRAYLEFAFRAGEFFGQGNCTTHHHHGETVTEWNCLRCWFEFFGNVKAGNAASENAAAGAAALFVDEKKSFEGGR